MYFFNQYQCLFQTNGRIYLCDRFDEDMSIRRLFQRGFEEGGCRRLIA